ncbi:Formimidoylglutamase [Frankliniella fusca]|uniref:Formimidoylglutamase n=1 Tax=Frankliniella fusca TaxID=407009 RepID=A0AAE1HFP5_9NEOP|nr:Formimidoylglutamase [Frankliniella fusca]
MERKYPAYAHSIIMHNVCTKTPNPGEAFTGSWRQNEERSTPGNVIFMNISETLDIREEEIAGPDTPFWLGLFQEYRENRST